MRELIELTPATVLTAKDGDRFLLKNIQTGQTEVLRCQESGNRRDIYFTRDACPTRRQGDGAPYWDIWQHLRRAEPTDGAEHLGSALNSREEFAEMLELGHYKIA
jgi:hypothetical protein